MNTAFRTMAAVGGLTLLSTMAQAAPDAAPAVKTTWKMDVPAGTKRIAVVDLKGDKSFRLLILDAEGTLTINKVTDAALTKEDAISLGKEADQFAVGQFVKDKPAVIAVPGAVFYRDGDKYSKKDAADLKTIHGSVRYADGTENLVVFGQGRAPHGYTIDLAADNPVKDGGELKSPKEDVELYRTLSPNLPAEMLAASPFPQELKKGGVIRLFVPEKSKKLYGLAAWQTDDSHLAMIDGDDLFSNTSSNLAPTWKSEKLVGKILDIAFGPSFKDAKQNGVYVLEESGKDGKARQLEFFAIQ